MCEDLKEGDAMTKDYSKRVTLRPSSGKLGGRPVELMMPSKVYIELENQLDD